MAAVAAVMRGRFVWGVSDCVTCAVEVFRRIHGRDPLAGLSWSSRAEAEALTAALGFVGTVSLHADLAGLNRVQMPWAGCLGVTGETLTIRVGTAGWAARTVKGFAIVPHADLCWSP